MIVASALALIGLVMTLSASSIQSAVTTGSAFSLFGRQSLFAMIGLTALFVTARLDYRKLRGWSYLSIPTIWVLLIMTRVGGIGLTAYGASRWIPIGPFSFQPSEAAKLFLLIFGADILSRKKHLLADWRHIVMPYLACVGVTCLIVLMQPDFGTMMIIAFSTLLLIFLAQVELKFIAVLTGIGILCGIPIMLAAPYRAARFTGFLGFLFGTKSDSLDSGFQSIQGLVALGSGGFFGTGLGTSRQKYFYLPNAHTDFIFAILGEETGLAGTLIVLTLFAVVAVCGIRIAHKAPDTFGFLLAAGITGWISIQVLINIGAVAGVLPITGVPLPLVSFGGSSLLFSLAGLGLVASVGRQSRLATRR